MARKELKELRLRHAERGVRGVLVLEGALGSSASKTGRWVSAEDKRPLCQLSSKRLEDNWHSGLLSGLLSAAVSSWDALAVHFVAYTQNGGIGWVGSRRRGKGMVC